MRVRRLLQLVSAVVFLDTVMFSAISPLLPGYTETLGLTKAGAGVLGAAYPAGTFLTALPAIAFARRFGVKSTVVVGLSLLTLSTVGFANAATPLALVVARFLQGVSGAFSWGGALGWLIGEAEVPRRGQTIGFALGAALAGAMLGPVLGGVAAQVSERVVFLSVAATSLALTAVTVAVPRPVRSSTPELRHIPVSLRDRRVRAGLWLVMLFGLSYGAVGTLAPLQMAEAGLGGPAIAAVFTGAVAIETLLSPVVGRISDARGRLAPVQLSLPVAVGVLVAFGWTASAALLVVLLMLCAVGIGPLWTPGTALFSDGAEEARVDHVVSFSLSNVSWALGGLIGAYSAGALAQLAGEPLPYSAIAAVLAATWIWVRSNRHALDRQPTGLASAPLGN